jgi:putative flippase GtrA
MLVPSLALYLRIERRFSLVNSVRLRTRHVGHRTCSSARRMLILLGLIMTFKVSAVGSPLQQVLRFLVVGATATAIDAVAYLLLVEAGTVPFAAKALSYAAGTLLGFLGNKFWAFGSARRSVGEPVTYGALYLATLAVNVGTNTLVLGCLSGMFSPEWERGIAFVVATGVTTTLNFLGLRFVTFRGGLRDLSEATRTKEQVVANGSVTAADRYGVHLSRGTGSRLGPQPQAVSEGTLKQ